jgi:uncharacterized protein (DUF1501 family)
MTSRRVFMKSGGLALLSLGFAPSFLARTVEAAGSRKKLLIAIFQRGAVDGLNMVVPYGEADYFRLRPSIAVARPGTDAGAIDLDGFFGLHPRMQALKPLWDDKTLAIVHAAGSPANTRSHFDAQDYMESATPGVKSTRDGWLNRYLQAGDAAGSPLRGIAVARTMPRSLQGRAPSLAIGSMAEFGVRGDAATRRLFEAAYARPGDALLGGTGGDAFEAIRTLQASAAQAPTTVEYPRSPFGQALREVARLARADVGLEVAFAETGNWDHHANEGGATGLLATRLEDFSRSLAALVADLGDRLADTVIVTMSEFGRTVAENGTRGTDHGHGNAMLVIGGAVRGGRVYGRWPGLAAGDRHEGRDLAVTTDFRDVFSEIVTSHLGASGTALQAVFPGFARSQALGLV